MKRIALTAVAAAGLLLLAALALPFWFGLQAEKSYLALLAQLSHRSGLQFTSAHYERGWFSSTAETVIRHPQISIALAARHRISHGPFPIDRIIAGDCQLIPVQARITSQIVLNTPAGQNAPDFPPLNTETTFQLNGDGAWHAEMAPIRKTGAPGRVIDWRGFSGDMRFDREWKKIRFEARMPALTLGAPGQAGGLSLSQLSLHSDLREGVAGFLFGDSALKIGQLQFGGAGGALGVDGLEISGAARPAGENVDLMLRYRVEAVRAADERFGPGELTIEARHLDAAALVKFKNELDAVYRGNPPPAQVALMMAGKAMELIATLSRQAPELELTKLSFKTPRGEITGKAKFVLDGRKHSAAQNPLQMLMALSGRGELAIPAAVLKQMLVPVIQRDIEAYQRSGALTPQDMARLTPQAMSEIVDRAFPQYLSRNGFTRYFVEDGDFYKLVISIRRGQLLVNGTPWHASLSPLARFDREE
ncbi:MAG: YdgA family protein [Bacteroidota bacterium]